MAGSGVTMVSACSIAWETSPRSKGSRCSSGRRASWAAQLSPALTTSDHLSRARETYRCPPGGSFVTHSSFRSIDQVSGKRLEEAVRDLHSPVDANRTLVARGLGERTKFSHRHLATADDHYLAFSCSVHVEGEFRLRFGEVDPDHDHLVDHFHGQVLSRTGIGHQSSGKTASEARHRTVENGARAARAATLLPPGAAMAVFATSVPSPPRIYGRPSMTSSAKLSRLQWPGPLCAQVPDRSRCRGQVAARLRADPEVRIGAPILASGMVRVGANPCGRRRAISFWKNACRSPPIPPARHDSRLYPPLRLPVTSPVSNRTGRRQSLD